MFFRWLDGSLAGKDVLSFWTVERFVDGGALRFGRLDGLLMRSSLDGWMIAPQTIGDVAWPQL